MRKLRTLSLFAGIGGFDLGLERTGGFETVAFCEIDPFCQEVLAKHWPNVPCFSDVRELRGDQVGDIDVICGGFPCQDLSTAGKQAGMGEGKRSGLWSEIVRLAGELRPSFIIVENVAALLRGPSEQPGRWFGRVLGDLAECGYDAEWENIPVRAVGVSITGSVHGYLPTPRKNDSQKRGDFDITNQRSGFPVAVKRLFLPTLGKQEPKGSSRKRYQGSAHFRGAKMSEGLRTCETDPTYLHPSFAEAVMGFPIGWTELEPAETP